MAIVHSPDSEYAKERRRWESQHTEFGPPGRVYTFQEFPKMLVKAGRNDAGKIVLVDERIANDEHEQRNLESRGFCVGPDEAFRRFGEADLELAKLAANRAWHEQRMSTAAREEARAYEADDPNHTAVIPEKPRRRPRTEE